MNRAKPIAMGLLALATLASGCAPTWRATGGTGEAARPSLFGFPWAWTDDAGERVELSRWRGNTLVVTMVYTSCLDTCPLTLDKLRKVHEEFARTGRRAEFVLVTLDPERDDAARLRQFRKSAALPDAWHLLSGSERDTQQLRDLLDIHVVDAESHLVHDARIAVFDGEGRSTAELDVL